MSAATREVALLRRAAQVAGQGILEAMHSTHPGIYEYHLEAAARYIFIGNGARLEGYRAIACAGIDNIWNMHYFRNSEQIVKDDLILLDYAPDYHNYVSDITRMWPVHDDVRLKLKHHVVHLCDSHWHRPAYASWGSSSKVKHWKSPGKGNRNGLSGDFFPPEQEIFAAVKGRA